MIWNFFDASALVKRYSVEDGTDIFRLAMDLHKVLQTEGHRLVLWSCDKRLLRAAKQEGINVFDPEVETKASLSALLKS
ncbi:MAG: hypothetical protein AAF639_24905 [Chloroflexota bacterium]